MCTYLIALARPVENHQPLKVQFAYSSQDFHSCKHAALLHIDLAVGSAVACSAIAAVEHALVYLWDPQSKMVLLERCRQSMPMVYSNLWLFVHGIACA